MCNSAIFTSKRLTARSIRLLKTLGALLLLLTALARVGSTANAADTSIDEKMPNFEKEFWRLIKTSKDPSPASLEECRGWIKLHLSDPRAKYMLGELGRLGYISTDSADQWLAPIREAAEDGYAPAQGLWGLILLDGDSVPPDPDAALSWMEKGTAQHDGLAYLAKADLYHTGTVSTPRDDGKAKILFEKAESQGYLSAKAELLALSLDHGDAAAAFSAMNKLAEAGFPNAMAYQGIWCIQGSGTTQDLAAGFKWIAAAAAANTPSNTAYVAGMGRLYYYGVGVDQDQAKGVQLLEKAYLGRCHDAGLALAQILFTDASRKDVSKASRVLQELSDLGDSSAQLELGRRMLVGDEVEKQTANGKKLLEASARSGNDDAFAILRAVEPAFAESLIRNKSLIAEFDIGGWKDPLIIPVWHNDALGCFLLDTGAAMSILDEKSFTGLKSTGQVGAVQMHSGSENHALYVAPHFHVGPFDLADNDVVMSWDLSSYQTALRLPLIGILGSSAVHASVVQIDYDQHKLRIMRSEAVSHDDWGYRVGTTMPGDIPELQITLGGMQLPFVLDTGIQNDGFLSQDVFARLITATTEPVGSTPIVSNQGRLDLRTFYWPECSIGPSIYSHLHFFESKMSNSGFGLPFIERHLTTIDYPNHRIYFKPGYDFHRPE